MKHTKTNNPNLDLAFENHFRGVVTQYTDGEGTESPFRLSNESPGGMTRELEGRTQTFRGLGGRAITATLFNEGAASMTIVHPGWLGDGEHALSRLQMSSLAEKRPGQGFAFVNMPGARGSEALPRSAIKEMEETGSFEAHGEHISVVLDDLRKNYDATKGVGWSTGARAMFGLLAARHGEAGFDNVVALDPPGSQMLGRIGLMNAFVNVEGGYAKRYVSDEQTVAARAEGAPKAPFHPKALWQGLYEFPVAMSRDGLEADMEKATKGLDESLRISVVSPEFSALTMPEDVAAIMRRLSAGTDVEMLHYIINNQSHTGLMDQNVPHFTQLIADLLSQH